MVILIKLSISTSTTELGTVLKLEDIKVSFYLEKLLIHLKAVAKLDDQHMHTLSAKFLEILKKVKMWFHNQGKQRQANEEPQPPAGFEPSGPPESKEDGPAQYPADKFSFLTDFSKAPTMNATTTWPTNQFQSPNGYTDPNYAMQPTWNDVAFDFPMDLDPNLFTHLIQADQTQNYQDNNDNVDGFNNQMDYFNNMPNFGTWPTQ